MLAPRRRGSPVIWLGAEVAETGMHAGGEAVRVGDAGEQGAQTGAVGGGEDVERLAGC